MLLLREEAPPVLPAAIAAARQGARTALIESKGYTGGIITEAVLRFIASSIYGRLFREWKRSRLYAVSRRK